MQQRLRKSPVEMQKNIDSLGTLLLNPAERALLLYGALARYQRELRGLLANGQQRGRGLRHDGRRGWCQRP